MKTTLHELPEGFIVTSDEVPKIGDKYFDTSDKESLNPIFERSMQIGYYDNCLKVIAQQDQIDFSALKEEEQKKIGWFDIEKEAMSYLDRNYSLSYERTTWQKLHEKTYAAGFQKAQELLSDRRFTLDDMQGFVLWLNDNWRRGKGGWYHVGDFYRNSKPIRTEFLMSEYIKFLSQPKSWEVEIEMEQCYEDHLEGGEFVLRPSGKRPELTNGKIKILKLL